MSETLIEHRSETRKIPGRTDGAYTQHNFVREVTLGDWRELPYKEAHAMRQAQPTDIRVERWENIYFAPSSVAVTATQEGDTK